MTLHKRKGTYNLSWMLIVRFFKWLYYPDVPPSKRPEPEVIQNIGKLKRLEKSICKPSDLWTEQAHYIFLKYCPSARDRFYHAMDRDTAARFHELLRLKIKDVEVVRAGPRQDSEITKLERLGLGLFH